RDPLLGDHQRAQREVEEAALAFLETSPVRWIAAQIDVLGRPVGVLPVVVESLRVLQLSNSLAHSIPRPRRPTGSGQPLAHLLQRVGFNVIEGPEAAPLRADDACLAKDLEVV